MLTASARASGVCVTPAGPAPSVTNSSVTTAVISTENVTTARACAPRDGMENTALYVSAACPSMGRWGVEDEIKELYDTFQRYHYDRKVICANQTLFKR